MGASKSYHLKLSEDYYNNLGNDEKQYLNYLGMEVRQIATEEDLKDENYKKIRNERIISYKREQIYLFDKRNK
jgi:hypothetical protein